MNVQRTFHTTTINLVGTLIYKSEYTCINQLLMDPSFEISTETLRVWGRGLVQHIRDQGYDRLVIYPYVYIFCYEAAMMVHAYATVLGLAEDALRPGLVDHLLTQDDETSETRMNGWMIQLVKEYFADQHSMTVEVTIDSFNNINVAYYTQPPPRSFKIDPDT